MKTVIQFGLIIMICCWSGWVLGQKSAKIKLIHGQVIHGEVIKIDSVENETVVLNKNQTITTIPNTVIASIHWNNTSSENAQIGFFSKLSYGALITYNTNTLGDKEGRLNGISGRVTLQYALLDRWKLGLLSGFDAYYSKNNEYLIPVLLTTTYYVKQNRLSPFIRLDGGYSFGIPEHNSQLVNNTGGFTVQPSVGVRLPAWDGMTTEFGVGIQWQENHFTQVRGDVISNYDLMYRRLVFSLGFTF